MDASLPAFWCLVTFTAVTLATASEPLAAEPVGTTATAPTDAEPQRVTTLDGKVYEEVREIKVTPAGIRFLHRDGAAGVDFEKLPAEMQQRYGYDADAARTFRQERMQREEAYATAVDAAVTKAEAPGKKKAAALAKLKQSGFAGQDYWDGGHNWRILVDSQERRKLMEAGYGREEANAILDELRSKGKAKRVVRQLSSEEIRRQLRSSPASPDLRQITRGR